MQRSGVVQWKHARLLLGARWFDSSPQTFVSPALGRNPALHMRVRNGLVSLKQSARLTREGAGQSSRQTIANAAQHTPGSGHEPVRTHRRSGANAASL